MIMHISNRLNTLYIIEETDKYDKWLNNENLIKTMYQALAVIKITNSLYNKYIIEGYILKGNFSFNILNENVDYDFKDLHYIR